MIKKKQKRKKNETALEGKKKRNNILLHISISEEHKNAASFITRSKLCGVVSFPLTSNLLINLQTSTDNEDRSSQGKSFCDLLCLT